MSKQIGDVILDVSNISLSFGGVKALTDISFNVREHEVRAIIGPNGAGKSSMLNCINGVYTPQQGSITFRGQTFDHMDSHQVAVMGIGRTFQNLALFKGMSVIDNIMTGRNLRIKSNLFLQAVGQLAHWGFAMRLDFQKVDDEFDFFAVHFLFALRRADAQGLHQQIALDLQVAPGHDVVDHAHALEQCQVLEGTPYPHHRHLVTVHVAE